MFAINAACRADPRPNGSSSARGNSGRTDCGHSRSISQVIALGEGAHGNEQGHAFRLSLIRDPRFAAMVNDILVESGNARYQELMDRFVRGDDIPPDSLRRVWQDTTVLGGWDRPIYEEFYRAVRAVNASLPRARQLRVLLGDPPIDWNSIRSPEELTKWQKERDRYPADLIKREVLAKQRRALVVYGDGHLLREMNDTLVGFLESTGATKLFTIATNTSVDLTTLQASVNSWRAPSMTLLRGTALGAKPSSVFFGRLPFDRRMDDQFDALLYLGSPSTITTAQLPPTLCSDAGYMEMRLARMAFMTDPPRTQAVEQLKRYCASQTAK